MEPRLKQAFAPHHPTFHNTRNWRLIPDPRKKTGRYIIPTRASRDIKLHKEYSAGGNEDITPRGGCGGRGNSRPKASGGRDMDCFSTCKDLAAPTSVLGDVGTIPTLPAPSKLE